MKINVSSIKKEIGSRQPFEFRCGIDQLLEETDEQWTSGQVLVEGHIANNGRMLEMEGTVHVKSFPCCGRCLEQYEAEFEFPFHELFQEEVAAATETKDEINYFHGDEIDISAVIRETIVLSEPLRTVCSEDCKGLCSSCGANLNTETCGCQHETLDPRLAALKKLLEKD